MKQNNKRKAAAIWGYLLFFITISVVVAVAVLMYDYALKVTGGDSTQVVAIMFIVILFLSGLVTTADAIRRKILVERPVEKILSATEKIAKGDFSVRINIEHSFEKYDEYDLIMENLNKVATELGKSEVLKTDFIANVSHELKTPLAVIQNYVTLMRTEKDSEKLQEYLKAVLSATGRLSNLVTNILKLNKLENQQINPEKEVIRLDETLENAIISFEDLLDKKAIEVSCDLEEASITSSPSLLEIVFNNLLSNAVKFTDEGGKITVSLKKTSGGATVAITDTGCGISAETGAHIFDKFYQGDTSRSAEGNGLGLALVKRVIDILGGEISVKSEVGKGSTFTIILREVVEL